ncbi:PocR ligand-binding domain-containing protein [Maridesulfovibrio sp. FT414]|uniref:PocR ligand-binding domain-containing protein n=1 Tax=Maridesulfovibrio sp. FT414 TaxID=2979469 RepID=UPI003D803D3C
MEISSLNANYEHETNERLAGMLFKDLVELKQLQNLLEVSYAATRMPSGIIDAVSGEIYAGAGWQRICLEFHRKNPESQKQCIESDTAITDRIQSGQHHGYKCANGLWDVGIPIMCMKKHVATFFLGQFFYEDEEPDVDFFIRQARKYNYNQKEYLAALSEVPRFSYPEVEEILKYNTALASFLSDSATKSMQNFIELEQKKKAEAEITTLRNYLANIIDSMPSILIGVNPEGQITQWNKGAEYAYGTSADKALGCYLQQTMPALAPQMENVRMAIETRRMQTYMNRPDSGDNDQPCEDITIYPLIANGVCGAVIRIDDVTNRVNLERMMVQSEKMLSIGGLAAGMAHEINNPLAGILGHASNIKNRLFSDMDKNLTEAEKCNVSLENMREYLENRGITRMLDGILEAGTRAATIVSNMLAFSRKSENKFSPQDINQLLSQTIDLASSDYDLNSKYDFRIIGITKELHPDLPLVYCERNEIQQVLLNIFKNGAEAMLDRITAKENPHFICKTYREDKMAVIEIEDNGMGMDEEVRKRIFEPFYTTKEIGKGTGLGLSVSYYIITDLHKGLMDVQSVPGKWTRFIIKLPFKKNH